MVAEAKYRRQIIHTAEPSERVLCVVGDLNGDGQPEPAMPLRRL